MKFVAPTVTKQSVIVPQSIIGTTCVEYLNEHASIAREMLRSHSVAIFGGSIRINLNDMTATHSNIVYGTSGYQEQVWFAECLSGYRRNRVYTVSKNAKLFHLPPIGYKKDLREWAIILLLTCFKMVG